MKWIKGYIEHIRESSEENKDFEKMFNSIAYKPYNAPTVEELQKILDSGYDPNWVNDDGGTLLGNLLYSADNYYTVSYLPLIEKLLEAGADPNKEFIETRYRGNKVYPLNFLLSNPPRKHTKELLSLLINAGADVNAVSEKEGTTPIMYAAFWANEEIINILISRGADAKAKDKSKFSALHYYFRARNVDTIYPFDFNAGVGRFNVNANSLRLLLDAGADPNWHVDYSNTQPLVQYPIILASVTWSGYTMIAGKKRKEKLKPYIGNIEALLNAGADPNVKLSWPENTPLFNMCEIGDIASVSLLLEKGADPNITNSRSLSPLWASDNSIIVKLLIQAGADPNSENHMNYSVLEYFVRKGKKTITKELIIAGADVIKAFKSFESFLNFFDGKIPWYKGDIEALQRKFKATEVRKKLF
jgi:ankyrin repeat protein